MRRFIALAFLLAAFPAWALVSIVDDAPQHGGGVSFTGVGDIVASAKGHWGVIAYSAATRGSNMLRLCDNAGGNCADAASDPTSGIVSSTQSRGGTCTGSLVGTTYTAGGHPCLVTTAYDDSGGSNCTGACDATQASLGFMPIFIPNYNGSVPAIYFKSNTPLLSKTGFSAITLPITMGMGVSVVTNSGSNDRMFSIPDSSGVMLVDHFGTPNFGIYDGNYENTAGNWAAGTMYSVIGDIAAAGANGGISLNGTRTAGTPGGQNSGTSVNLGSDGGLPCDCAATEFFVYASQLSGGNLTTVTSTMRTNGGY